MNSGQWTVGSGQWTEKQWAVNSGHGTVGSGQLAWDSWHWTAGSGQCLVCGYENLLMYFFSVDNCLVLVTVFLTSDCIYFLTDNFCKQYSKKYCFYCFHQTFCECLLIVVEFCKNIFLSKFHEILTSKINFSLYGTIFT